MKRYILSMVALLFLLPVALLSQELNFSYKATRVLMDSTWDTNNEPVVKGIIEFYKPEMDRIMQQVIGESEVEMRSSRPESLLSNFAADLLLEYGREKSSSYVDFSLTNFGGLRAALPKGPVRRYDIFSIFPFENYVVVLDVPGSSVRKLFDSFARNRVEAFSHNVQLEIRSGALKDVLIDGQQIDDSKTYRIVTIDFLMSGGDNLLALKDATAVEQTGALLRDAVIESIEALTAKKKKITSAITKRVKFEE
ncbi:MAG: nucleotide phosphoesterase [Bacteroidetes bacterium HGW-Bacteroidetes-7]|jgi:2',3'-cyclic-nucleotide 2'-phosphodiesterase (5'-nucleotidase family)|nr:MAG: nucleotide phosphoesterase [Bacteroidetes bacterium HGW-Bacteroidetes-7]